MPAWSGTSHGPASVNQGPHTSTLPGCPHVSRAAGAPTGGLARAWIPWRETSTRSEHRAGCPRVRGPSRHPRDPSDSPRAHTLTERSLSPPLGRGGAGSDISGDRHTAIGVFPTQTPNGPARTACWQLRPQSTGWVWLIWGTQAAGPQLCASSPGTQRAWPALCPKGGQAGGWAAPLRPSPPTCTRVSLCNAVRPRCPRAPPDNTARRSSCSTRIPTPSYQGPRWGPQSASSSRRGSIWDKRAPSPPEHAPDHPPEPRFQHF